MIYKIKDNYLFFLVEEKDKRSILDFLLDGNRDERQWFEDNIPEFVRAEDEGHLTEASIFRMDNRTFYDNNYMILNALEELLVTGEYSFMEVK